MEANTLPVLPDPAADAQALQKMFSHSTDLAVRAFEIDGRAAAAVFLDGMCDEMKITECVIKPLTDGRNFTLFGGTAQQIRRSAFKGAGLSEARTLDEAALAVTEGSLALFLEGEKTAFLCSVQGFPKKGIEAPEAEQNERGSGESFADNYKDNITLLRRRLKTPLLTVERTVLGKTSRTAVLYCYLRDRADAEMLQKLKRRLTRARLDTLCGSGVLKPYMDGGAPALFSGVGFTQRPDILAAKLAEGRIGVIVDGTPFALIVPYLLVDYFHATDDYMSFPAYALFIRLLRAVCFIVSAALPGLFVAVCDFHPEVLPPGVMLDIAAAEAKTPFSLMTEAVAIHLLYEVVREAGLRMPLAVGQAVSIVGALAVGDAAVTAGLIAAPMLMVVAVTAVSSAVVSKLHESVALIRFALILLGGLTGLFGVFAASGLLLAAVCCPRVYGVPFSAPFIPFTRRAQRDALLRTNDASAGDAGIGELES